MIIEDENGRDIDLADLRDDHEPEEPEAEPQLDLDEIEKLLGYTEPVSDPLHAEEQLFDVAIPQLIAEIRHWRSLEREEQHGVLHGDEWIAYDDAESATKAAKLRCGTAGIRDVYVTPWQPLSNEPPF